MFRKRFGADATHRQRKHVGKHYRTTGLDAQYYTKDPAIGALEVPDRFRMNAFLYLQYKKGGFSAGLSYEAYLPKPCWVSTKVLRATASATVGQLTNTKPWK